MRSYISLFYVLPSSLSAYLCTKLHVPSTGSIIQVGLSVRTHFEPAAVDSSAINLHLVWSKTSVPENWLRYVTWKVKRHLSVFEEILHLYTHTLFCINVYVCINTHIAFFIWEWKTFTETLKERSQIYSILFYMVKKNSIYVHFPNIPLRKSRK